MAVRYEWLVPGEVPRARAGYEVLEAEPVRRRYRTIGHYLRVGAVSKRYRPGQRVPIWYAARWPSKVTRVRRLERVRWRITERKIRRVRAVRESTPQVYEVTISYRGSRRTEDVTVRLIPTMPGARSVDDAKAAFWVAHVHGPGVLRGWRVEAIDWRGYRYAGSEAVEDALRAMRSIIAAVGWRGLRIGRVREGG